jgi:hypothetical protein
MFFIAQTTMAISSICIQVLTVVLPMLLSGIYSMFCWLLAEPIVMPIWNNYIKPGYDGLLSGMRNFGIGCANRWRKFWSDSATTQTPTEPDNLQNHTRREQKPKTFGQRICPLLFKGPRKSTSKISAFSSKTTESSLAQERQSPPARPQGLAAV